MEEYLKSHAAEILSKFRRVSKLIKHPGAIGSYHEHIIKSFIKSFLSNRYSVHSGFIYNSDLDKSSKQIDILIIDENYPSPYLFKEGEFVIVKPEATILAIEVKTTLSKETFIGSIFNQIAFREACGRYGQFIIFSFESEANWESALGTWYQSPEIAPMYDEYIYYPHSIYCLNRGWLSLLTKEYADPWGHYFFCLFDSMTDKPSEDKEKNQTYILSIFLASVVKRVDLSAEKATNPYSLYAPGVAFIKNECYRYGSGKDIGKIKKDKLIKKSME